MLILVNITPSPILYNKPEDLELAVCGVDCTQCLLKNAATDIRSAQHLVGWFRNEGWLNGSEGATEIMKKGPYCNGCRGDRSTHWSSTCQFFACCHGTKHLHNCSQCDDFACEPLRLFYKRDSKTKKAHDRLIKIRAGNQDRDSQ